MNVASLELCKELYELSHWGKSAFPYHIHDGLQKYFTYADGSNVPYVVDGTAYSLSEDERNGQHIPAYDLGYLLRKLPVDTAIIKERQRDFGMDERDGFRAQTRYNDGYERKKQYIGVTPEDAACKLAIELFKEGIL